MVTKITFPKRVESALNYNEAKVQKGHANCLNAVNYLRDAGKMNFYQKLDGLERLNVLNDRATVKTIHVSLNFNPTEKFTESRLLDIASAYMERIGFGDQPYLIYQHRDAGHPHLHIVSTTIRSDGSRINTHNIGRNQSETARKEIEIRFGLTQAAGCKNAKAPVLKPADTKQVLYGKDETKDSISAVVRAVFYRYRFASLPEYNAALKQFNVVADPGKEGGRINRNGGLTYRILDARGAMVGVPIKASSLPFKPTLNNLATRFKANDEAKSLMKPRVHAKLEETLAKQPCSIQELASMLERRGVYTALRQNAEGRLYGITFVDNYAKCVFNGSDLGKEFSAGSLQSKLQANGELKAKQKRMAPSKLLETHSALNTLLTAQEASAYLPHGLLKKKRKKRRNNSNT